MAPRLHHSIVLAALLLLIVPGAVIAQGELVARLARGQCRPLPQRLTQLAPIHAAPADPSVAKAYVSSGPGESKSATVVVQNGVTILNQTSSSSGGSPGWDAAPLCPASHGEGVKDSNGHLWGWDADKKVSCAVRTQAPAAPAANTTSFSSAPRCPFLPTSSNSKPDSYGNLW
jgi:hypothetical protein